MLLYSGLVHIGPKGDCELLNTKQISEVGFLLLDGAAVRSIMKSYPVSSRVLARLKKEMANHKIDTEKWISMSGDEKARLCYPAAIQKKTDHGNLEEEFETIYQKMKRQGSHYTLSRGWHEYKKRNLNGLQRSQFSRLYKIWEDKEHPGRMATAPVYRQPGKFLYIDWIGDQPALVRNPDFPDKPLKAHFLVFTIGYSSLTFAAAYPDEKAPNVVDGINLCLEYMGALPQCFRPDNMKTAVTRNTRDELKLSTAMEDVQRFYSTPVMPARPHKPKDKASVERAVLILEQELLPQLETLVFEDFSDLNKEIVKYLEKLNTRVKTGETLSRKELFEKYDKPNMKPLPPEPLKVCEYKKLKVQRNCHVKTQNVYYSVPYKFVGQEVIVKISEDDLTVCDSNNRWICTHKTNENPDSVYVTNPGHLKSNYQKQRAIDVRGIHYYLDNAEKYGRNMRRFIQAVIDRCEFEEQSFKSCEGILRACDKYPRELAERTAADCLRCGSIGYGNFIERLSLLARSSDIVPISMERPETEPDHQNIRGEGYYK